MIIFFLTLHNLRHFLLSGHNDSRAACILLTGPIRRYSSGGGSFIWENDRCFIIYVATKYRVGGGGRITFSNFFPSNFRLEEVPEEVH